MLHPSHAIAPRTFQPMTMGYSEYKALQALLFLSLPVICCVSQLIALKRSSDATEIARGEAGVGLTPSAPRT